MLTIAVDAMGGDHAPKREVEGAIRAAEELQIGVILVGLEDVIRTELALHPRAAGLPIEVHHASEFITMEDSAAKAVRTKKDSSIRVACRLVRDGVAQGVVSAGNTGAVMATAKIVQGVIRGVTRPVLASALPSLTGSPVVLLDVGANVDCKPEMLAQFAVMGEIYSRTIFHNSRPRVGLLSIGEEEHKGNDLTRAALPLLKALPINFIGNVEGRDIFGGVADVIVCDGFIGNVALKVSEGLVDMFVGMLRESLSATMTRKIGSLLSREAYREFKKRLDYAEYGGAPLLGVKGVSTICHGRSNANAVKNAIRVAAEFAQGRVNEKIEEELDRAVSSKVAAP
ncbi:MAG TPA: phosphate acyltransferase PlsX [Bryobacteraceae bacterium]|jgi:glycerol-3-phosphate acyltransferase PlsX|nr:phosphate acyltransferase PlsX [Bryobacteraceae bacterium]